MVYSNSAVISAQEEVVDQQELLELIEAHRKLVDVFGADLGREEDTFSLAQPSPYRYVPTVATTERRF